jgi:nucleotide-binding universal stress UspA family protein
MSKRIVVGIDFSEDSLNAFRHAITIAEKAEMAITMVWVDHIDYSKEIFNIDPSHRLNAVTNKFNQILKEYQDRCPQLDFVIRKGKVYKELCEVADEVKAFLVIVGTHGLSGFEEFWSGSNANRIVAACNVPVITIRGGVTVKKDLERIVLPLDSTKTTREKIPITAELAKYFNSEIHILGLMTSQYNDIRFRIKDYVLQAEDYFKENDIKFKSVFLESKHITDDTIDYAKKIDANLISIMTEQETTTANLWLGPYAAQMVNHSPIPVLSVKPKEYILF